MRSERRRDHNAETIGALLKAAREKAGLTQKAVADAVGLNYYTMISQMELGYVSVPAGLWVKLPDVLGLDRQDFVLRFLSAHQPEVSMRPSSEPRATIRSRTLSALSRRANHPTPIHPR